MSIRNYLKRIGYWISWASVPLMVDKFLVQVRPLPVEHWARLRTDELSIDLSWPFLDQIDIYKPPKSEYRSKWAIHDKYTPSFAPSKYHLGSLVTYSCPIDNNVQLKGRIIAGEGDIIRPLSYSEAGSVRIPAGHCWIESSPDDRDMIDSQLHKGMNAADSNYFGPVPIGLISSRIFVYVWPFVFAGKKLAFEQRRRVRYKGIPDSWI